MSKIKEWKAINHDNASARIVSQLLQLTIRKYTRNRMYSDELLIRYAATTASYICKSIITSEGKLILDIWDINNKEVDDTREI